MIRLINPLDWIVEDFAKDHWSAQTPFGSYTVRLRKADCRWYWGYCFDEYLDEGEFTCESEEAGKIAAQDDWNGRLSGVLSNLVPATPK